MSFLIRRGTGRLDFLVEVISNRRVKFKLLGLQGDPTPQFPPLVEYSLVENPGQGAWSAYCNNFEKSE